MLRRFTASPGLSAPSGLPITVGLAGVGGEVVAAADTLAVVFIGKARKSTCERSMVALVVLAPISEKAHAGKVLPVTSDAVGVEGLKAVADV